MARLGGSRSAREGDQRGEQRVRDAAQSRHRHRGPATAAGAAELPGDWRGEQRSLTDVADGGELITEIYRTHGLGLVRLALVLVGDKPTAEDVVQDAFIGLFRGLDRLSDNAKALAYLRVSVVNGCRSVHRARRAAFLRPAHHEATVWSAESAVLADEESRLALQAVSRLPARAREVIALRYYLDMPDAEIAATLGVSRGTVSSTASRALASLTHSLREQL
jgi:RNA polymerase sigma factor (sigma-70 family)